MSEWYWGNVYSITRDFDHLLFEVEGGKILMAEIGSGVTKMEDAPRVQRAKPWTKFFRYVKDGIWNRVTKVQNRASDCLPIDLSTGEYFLIRRKDNGKLAIPGGMIDPEEVIDAERADWVRAAFRELKEETGINPSQCLAIHPLMDEPLLCDDPREHTVSMPHIAIVKPGVRGFGADDAEAETMPGFNLGTVPPHLAFSHHETMIRMASAWVRGYSSK